jgi:hypothetical protein
MTNNPAADGERHPVAFLLSLLITGALGWWINTLDGWWFLLGSPWLAMCAGVVAMTLPLLLDGDPSPGETTKQRFRAWDRSSWITFAIGAIVISLGVLKLHGSDAISIASIGAGCVVAAVVQRFAMALTER